MSDSQRIWFPRDVQLSLESPEIACATFSSTEFREPNNPQPWQNFFSSFFLEHLGVFDLVIYKVSTKEEEIELVNSFCSALLGSLKAEGCKQITLGVFASFQLNQRVLRAVTCTMSSLTELTLGEVDKLVLKALKAQQVTFFPRLLELTLLFIAPLDLQDAFLVSRTLKESLVLKDFEALFAGIQLHHLALILGELGRSRNLDYCIFAYKHGTSSNQSESLKWVVLS